MALYRIDLANQNPHECNVDMLRRQRFPLTSWISRTQQIGGKREIKQDHHLVQDYCLLGTHRGVGGKDGEQGRAYRLRCRCPIQNPPATCSYLNLSH